WIVRLFLRPGLWAHFPGTGLHAGPVLLDQRMFGQLARCPDAGAGARGGHELDVPFSFWRVMAAVVTPVAEERSPPLGPARRAGVRGETNQRALLGPGLTTHCDGGRDVVIAIELHRHGDAQITGFGNWLLDLGGFRAVEALGLDRQQSLDIDLGSLANA